MRVALSLLLVSLTLALVQAEPSDLKKDIPWEELSNREISKEWGEPTLKEIQPEKWKHGETDHFIIHYTKDASKIARRAEEIYAAIFEFLQNPPDRRADKKSHIYAIHEWEDFVFFRKTIARIPWVGGVCRGNEFWFPSRDERGDFDSKGRILNHEMTHLVFNRIFIGRVPLWLNEGTAEYFGMKENMGTAQFRRYMSRRGAMPLKELLEIKTLSNKKGNEVDMEAIDAFYGQAAVFIDFLTEDYPKEKLVELINKSAGNPRSEEILKDVYGFESMEDLEKKFEKYRRKFE
jgi:hypothetical protein